MHSSEQGLQSTKKLDFLKKKKRLRQRKCFFFFFFFFFFLKPVMFKDTFSTDVDTPKETILDTMKKQAIE